MVLLDGILDLDFYQDWWWKLGLVAIITYLSIRGYNQTQPKYIDFETDEEEKIADYVLGNRTSSQLPDIAISGLEEDLESESLLILAGMSKNDNSFEIARYFNKMLEELGTELPSKLEAANVLITLYLNKMVSEPENGFDLMTKIHNEIYHANEWSQTNPELKKEFVGEELGLQHLYTWYRELQDFGDGSMLLYHNDLPPKEQKKKFESHLIKEAKNWLELKRENKHITLCKRH